MSLCKSTILKSEVTSTPVKLKYSQALGCGGELGLEFSRGVNVSCFIYENSSENTGLVSYKKCNGTVINSLSLSPGQKIYAQDNTVTIVTGSITISKVSSQELESVSKQQFLRYRMIRQLYYMNYVSGSLLGTGSAWESNWQSTAASGTFEHDNRYFPTQSNAEISVLSIPRKVFGERIAASSFNFSNTDCTLIDDGNGNVVDSQNDRTHVGNILYAQGIIVITHEDYQDIFPRAPMLMNHYQQFDQYDNKEFDMLVDEDPGTGTFDYTTLKLFGTSQSHLYTVNTETGHVTLNTTLPGNYYTYYTVKNLYNSAGCSLESNVGECHVEVFKQLSCSFAGTIWQNDCRILTGSVRFNYCDIIADSAVVIPPPTPSITPTISVTPTVTKTPTVTRTPSKTPTVTPSVTPSISITPSITVSPYESVSRTPSVTPSETPSNTPSISITKSPGASSTPSPTISVTASTTPSLTPSRTPSKTPSRTPSVSPPNSPPNSPSNSPSVTPSRTPSITPSPANYYSVYHSGGVAPVYVTLSISGVGTILPSTQIAVNSSAGGYSGILPIRSNQTLVFSLNTPGYLIASISITDGVTPTQYPAVGSGASSVSTSGLSGNVNVTFTTKVACYYYTQFGSPYIDYTNCSGVKQYSVAVTNMSQICGRYASFYVAGTSTPSGVQTSTTC